jgi:hypothetical protein
LNQLFRLFECTRSHTLDVKVEVSLAVVVVVVVDGGHDNKTLPFDVGILVD